MNRLQALRTEKGINMKEAAQALSMPYTTYVNYEKGTREPSSEVLIKLAKFYDTSIDYLVGKVERVAPIPAGFQPLPKRDRIPRVGQIACGTPILAEENVEAYDEVPSDWHADFLDDRTERAAGRSDLGFLRVYSGRGKRIPS